MAATSEAKLGMIFDMDGVLVHSMPLHTEAWRQYLTEVGAQVKYLEQKMHGKRNAELVREMLGSELSDDVVFEHGAAKERRFRELMAAADLEQYRIRGLQEFLERHKDIPKAVGSNGETANTDFLLDRFGLRPYFSITVDGSQVARPKPYPDIYLRAADLLGIEPVNCIVFEDSPTGVEAALAAGMRVVGIETTPTTFVNIDLLIEDFSDPLLEDWLNVQQPVSRSAC